MPKVSVIMGVYNTRKKEILENAIMSILNQTLRDFEFIICDDGSTDNTMNFIIETCQNDDRVIILKNETNMGLAYTLNKCLKIAKGEYIARMDADDESILTRLEKQVEFLDNNKEYGLVGTNINLFDEKRGIWGIKKYTEHVNKEDFLYNVPLAHPAIMARKEAYQVVNGYRDIKQTIRVEDYDCFMRMQKNEIKIYNIQEELLKYREDDICAKKKKYRYRFNEVWVRYNGFKELGLLNLKNYIYIVKPLIAGVLPQKIIKRFSKL